VHEVLRVGHRKLYQANRAGDSCVSAIAANAGPETFPTIYPWHTVLLQSHDLQTEGFTWPCDQMGAVVIAIATRSRRVVLAEVVIFPKHGKGSLTPRLVAHLSALVLPKRSGAVGGPTACLGLDSLWRTDCTPNSVVPLPKWSATDLVAALVHDIEEAYTPAGKSRRSSRWTSKTLLTL
jgi:hypothetical protein